MAGDSTLFDEAKGSVIRGYILLKEHDGNVPPAWIDRAKASRKKRQTKLAKILKSGKVKDILQLEDWELAYQKECFYYGIRLLMELERSGKTKL